MRAFHKDKRRYFDIQYKTAKEHIIPFLSDQLDFDKKLDVLEIGCAEAGVLKAFTELENRCVGIELLSSRIKLASGFMSSELESGLIRFINKNIYDIDIEKDIGNRFDLIILKDVIEHIPDQVRFMDQIGNFLKNNGVIFFGFPPWQMPFGGHQQICESKFLSYLPYYHLLPMRLYKGLLKAGGESDQKILELEEIKETGISLERFEYTCKKSAFQIRKRKLFFINPIYQYKFNLRPRKQLGLIASIPYLRNFLTTCGYYVISK